MRPILFNIFGWPVHSYGLMLAIAFVVAIHGMSKTARRYEINLDSLIDLAVWVLIGAVLGARLAYVITEYRYYLAAPVEILKINSGGLAFHGGLIGGFLAGYWFVKRRKLPPWTLADLAAPFIALGYAIVRIGCLLNGCCFGIPSKLPWAFACSAGDSLPRHPTQLYSLLGSLMLFFILWRLRNHRQFPGFLFLLYIGLYSIIRFGVEYFREGPKVLPWLSLAQAVCIGLALLSFGLIWIISLKLKGRAGMDAGAKI